jgi:hypothetical protein
MEDLVNKVGHRLPEVSDRAVKAIWSKVNCRLAQIEDFLQIDSGMVCGMLLHWINERQNEVEIPTLMNGLALVKLAA